MDIVHLLKYLPLIPKLKKISWTSKGDKVCAKVFSRFCDCIYLYMSGLAKIPPFYMSGRYMKKQFNKWKDKMQFLHNSQEEKSCQIEAKLQRLRVSHENLQLTLQHMKEEIKVQWYISIKNHHSYEPLLNTNNCFSCRLALLIPFHASPTCIFSHLRFFFLEKADKVLVVGIFLFCVYLASSTDIHVNTIKYHCNESNE